MTAITRYLTQQHLAERWRMSVRTLERWRAKGTGPAWYLLGSSIRYRLADVEDFEDRQRHGRIQNGDAS